MKVVEQRLRRVYILRIESLGQPVDQGFQDIQRFLAAAPVGQQGGKVPRGPEFDGPGEQSIDGWLISFHADEFIGEPTELLGLYFCPRDRVAIRPTDLAWAG